MYSKKRYAALKFEDPAEHGKLDVKGLALVRRDFSPITRDILKKCLDTVLYNRDIPAAICEAIDCVRCVLDNEVPIDKFVMSKTLRTGYKNKCQPHLVVANKIFGRTGNQVHSGVRVPFVHVEDKSNLDSKQSLRVEDPVFVKENGLVIDRLFYIEHQLMKPLISLFVPLVDDPEKEIFGNDIINNKIEKLRSEFKSELKIVKRVKKNISNNQREITRFFKRSDISP